MAKIRVYELAKDLNMTNRELMEKVADLNIEVSSHMSSLNDDSVKRIRSELFGTSDKKVDEKRIRPTVIRRRRKTKETKDNLELSPRSVLKEEQSPEENMVSVMTDSMDKTDSSMDAVSKKKPAPSRKNQENDKNCSPKLRFASNDSARIISKPKPGKSDNGCEVSRANMSKTTDKGETRANEPKLETGYKSCSDATATRVREREKPVDTSSPVAEVSIDSPKGKMVKQSLNKDDFDLRPTEVKEDFKFQKRKTKKASTGKIIKQKDAPAKIIKRADPLKIETKRRRPLISAQSTPIEYGTNVVKASVPEQPKRKVQKKKQIFKKKEVVEGVALYSGKKRGRRTRKAGKAKFAAIGKKTQITVAKAIKRRIKIDETIVLADLAKRLGIKANEMIGKLMSMGVMVTVNQTIDFDTACLVANEFSYEVERASFKEETILSKIVGDDPSKRVPRPPVVTIMGHVDHGKTSLLDTIRKTRVTEGEAGGITQHIGAYHVETEKGVIVFLDTPGHEAFSAMRSRGAKVTDIVVLVVAADDGVMPQTIEAINHSKASGVPILVAINKMDRLDANSERVLRELSEHGLVSENWGGDMISVEVSAKQNQGIDTLLEMILLQAEMLELKANADKLAIGHVVESRLDSGRGPVATVLIQEGTLRSGESVVCGMHYGKVRALQDDIGNKVGEAGPSMPVEIIGLSGVPMAGDELVALEYEKDARQVSMHRMQKQRSKELAKTSRLSLEGLFERMQKGEIKDLNLIIKADVDGSIEALKDSLIKLSNDEVGISVVHAATGTISESDVSLAAVSNAIIIGFNVRPNAKVHDFALDENVDIRFYDVIYNVIKDVKDAIVGMMDSTYEERLLGRTDVRQVFHVPKIGSIAGCYVTDGKIVRGKPMRLLRDGIVVYQGKNASLRRFKDDVKEVQGGYECGIGIENFNDIKVGDVIESYYMEEIKPEID